MTMLGLHVSFHFHSDGESQWEYIESTPYIYRPDSTDGHAIMWKHSLASKSGETEKSAASK